ISSNTFEESVGSHVPRVILFGVIPTIIPAILEVPVVLVDPIVVLEEGTILVISPVEVLDLVDYSLLKVYTAHGLVYCDNDLVATGAIRVLHVPSRYQYADIFTKGLPTSLFDEFRTSLSIRSSPAPTAEGC
ncbi:hypothetical protein Tco_1549906, partial [Tanacetum coccineum]